MRGLRSSVPALLLLAVAACGDIPEHITAADGPSKAVLAPVCVYFNPPLYADTVGAPNGNVPGDLWFVENAIPVTLHAFHHPAPNPPSFGMAFVRPAIVGPPPFGAGKIARTNNINLGFDFSGVGFTPSSVTFDWRDYGGHENLKVNGSGVFVGELTAAPSPWGGAAVAHAWWAGAGFKQGTTTLTGPVTYLRVGGQEFFLDNVCANP